MCCLIVCVSLERNGEYKDFRYAASIPEIQNDYHIDKMEILLDRNDECKNLWEDVSKSVGTGKAWFKKDGD